MAQPTLGTPNTRPTKSVVRWTPPQKPTQIRVRNSAVPSSENLQKTPVKVQTSLMIGSSRSNQNTPSSISKQTPVRDQLIAKTPISLAQQASRKLIQKSVRILSSPRSTQNTPLPKPIRLFPPTTQHDQGDTKPSGNTTSLIDKGPSASSNLSPDKHVDVDAPSTSYPRQPLINIPKLPPQHPLMPQDNPFDIQSDLTPYQKRDLEPVFKTPELDDFLLPPVLGDQITDSTLMYRHLDTKAF